MPFIVPLPLGFETATEVLGALFFGWLCDRAGRSISMAFSCLFLLIGVALIYANFIAANHWGLWEGEPLISVALVAAGFLVCFLPSSICRFIHPFVHSFIHLLLRSTT